MILPVLILIPLAGGVVAWLLECGDARRPRWVCLAALTLDLLLVLVLWAVSFPRMDGSAGGWIAELRWSWIPRFGIGLRLAMDGISLLLSALTVFLGIAAVAASWTEIREQVGFFHFNLMWVLSGVLGVFLSLDLFLFYFFWELMLVPMYFLIAVWGHENRIYAAVKFFLFTQLSGLLMLLAILGLYFVHHRATGVYTFDYERLLGTPMGGATSWWLMLGFFAAFAVKLPAVPLHTWLPDAHTEAPTAGSVILAGLLLKTGAYGLLRFAVPLFPEAARAFAPLAMALGAAGILYGALLAFAQSDLKRLVAYTSVSHLGFVMLGIYSGSVLALQGAVLQMICHGLSTGGLFILAGALQERIHTRDMDMMEGLWAVSPRMAGAGLFFALASLGLPGIGNFVAEFLVLLGAYRVDPAVTAVAVVGLVAATVYSLRLVQQTFHGSNVRGWTFPDFTMREMVVMAAMIALLLWIGLRPQTLIDTAAPDLYRIAASVSVASAPAGR
ncbi:MAG: NADH-quinone oxidoreductase subunit M [Deltaproteobacteria bacterium]|nr:NADH-quinone oxidoreductase subunit M [Deltaproteobacteria bacterium]